MIAEVWTGAGRPWNGTRMAEYAGCARWMLITAACAALGAPTPVAASAVGGVNQEAPEADETPRRQRPGQPRIRPRASARGVSPYRDAQGQILFGLNGGYGFGNGVQFGSAGVHFGYAVLTGVVPGVRANVFFGGLSGGQVVGTLWLTPPVSFAVVPFAVGEIGYVWQDIGGVTSNGTLFGVGGGLHLGRPTDRLGIRAGAIYRVFNADGDGYFSPLAVASFRF